MLVLVQKASRLKLCPQLCEAVSIGYPRGLTRNKLQNFEKIKLGISLDVPFDELGEARKASLSPREDDEERQNPIDLMADKPDEGSNENFMKG